MDNRIELLAKNLINYSVGLKKGEKVLIEAIDIPSDMVTALIREAYAVGGLPFVLLGNQRVIRELYMGTSTEHMKTWAKYDAFRMSDMDAYIGIRGASNSMEYSDIPTDKMAIYSKEFFHPVHHEIRVEKTKWVVLRYPNPSMAQLSNMSTSAFEDFYFNVCNLDYSKMDKAMNAMSDLFRKTDKVRIVSPDTDLRFSIKGISNKKCSGHMNIPDGEIYTAPVRNSVNGTIRYNAPSIHDGLKYEDVRFTFKDGKIIEATANHTKELNDVLNTDEGARYIGEFAIGVNPYITRPMGDILFDEKISGSIHFTPGSCYRNDANNGNESAIHWDLILIQTPEFGGGEIYFDDRLIRKDGRFVIKELECLNPENLK